MSTIEEAFTQVCTEAEDAQILYVSLYRSDRGFGGHEEGGWYYTDDTLVASQRVYSTQVGEELKAAVVALAEKLTQQAEDDRNRILAAECEFLEARGVDDYDDNPYLSPPDGGSRFWVAVEAKQGTFVSLGDRAYS